MRTFLTILVVAAAAAFPLDLRAQCGGSAADSDYKCTNACPLAKTASTRRANGLESVLVSESVRDVVAKTVAANLDRI